MPFTNPEGPNRLFLSPNLFSRVEEFGRDSDSPLEGPEPAWREMSKDLMYCEAIVTPASPIGAILVTRRDPTQDLLPKQFDDKRMGKNSLGFSNKEFTDSHMDRVPFRGVDFMSVWEDFLNANKSGL